MMNRTACFTVIARHIRTSDVVVSSYSSAFEWLALQPPGLVYLAVGTMGLDTSHALGLALALPDRRIVTLQGDGSLMVNLGSLATLAEQAPKNLVHITCRNTIYEANGGHPIPSGRVIDFSLLARGAGLTSGFSFAHLAELEANLPQAFDAPGPVFICVDVEAGAPPVLTYEKLHAPDLIQRFQADLGITITSRANSN
jgi:thiamine pyrophosphate-dependent acetolactate synthase large subunit-like protein